MTSRGCRTSHGRPPGRMGVSRPRQRRSHSTRRACAWLWQSRSQHVRTSLCPSPPRCPTRFWRCSQDQRRRSRRLFGRPWRDGGPSQWKMRTVQRRVFGPSKCGLSAVASAGGGGRHGHLASYATEFNQILGCTLCPRPEPTWAGPLSGGRPPAQQSEFSLAWEEGEGRQIWKHIGAGRGGQNRRAPDHAAGDSSGQGVCEVAKGAGQ